MKKSRDELSCSLLAEPSITSGYQAGEGELVFEFERSVAALEAANVAFLGRYEARGGSPACFAPSS